ncbi:hypothetical protein CDD82_792 [Ophiocordyceps australis]|uniref:Uncharacterized protein n=1 Tax=Ophiocordyceps australis TaxID=1399860 RepID=A0A2C5YF80_9HYPO|nr:hypothetical protein CDD82_792 [Ophiocordyceps australis]
MTTGDAAQPLREADEPITPMDHEEARKAIEKELLDKLESRVTDKGFNIKKYPDPLRPRKGLDSRHQVNGVAQETEREWLGQIEALRLGKSQGEMTTVPM